MENETKYRRWAWGALIGLAIVIVVAGFIMAMTLSTPKPKNNATNQVATNNTEVKNDEKTTETTTNDTNASNNQKTETKPETTSGNTTGSTGTEQSKPQSSDDGVMAAGTAKPANNIPKTGPEDAILPIAALAICGYLFAYNVVLFKKNA
jgi:cytoskeletal protein RodZ